MQREIMWTSVDTPGLEHLGLTFNADKIIADAEIITTLFDDRPLRVDYWLLCDGNWQARELRVSVEGDGPQAIDLISNGNGSWTDEEGNALTVLDGCVDVDVVATPFTNTLPIRRLGLAPGKSAEIAVAWVDLPSLEIINARQRYTCLETGPDGGRYRFESLTSGYTNELPVDADGLVMDYPGIWRRVWPPTSAS